MAFELRTFLVAQNLTSTNIGQYLANYGSDDAIKTTWDEIQQFFMCCGAYGSTNPYMIWMNYEPFHSEMSVPESCCITKSQDCGVDLLSDSDCLISSKVIPICLHYSSTCFRWFKICWHCATLVSGVVRIVYIIQPVTTCFRWCKEGLVYLAFNCNFLLREYFLKLERAQFHFQVEGPPHYLHDFFSIWGHFWSSQMSRAAKIRPISQLSQCL